MARRAACTPEVRYARDRARDHARDRTRDRARDRARDHAHSAAAEHRPLRRAWADPRPVPDSEPGSRPSAAAAGAAGAAAGAAGEDGEVDVGDVVEMGLGEIFNGDGAGFPGLNGMIRK